MQQRLRPPPPLKGSGTMPPALCRLARAFFLSQPCSQTFVLSSQPHHHSMNIHQNLGLLMTCNASSAIRVAMQEGIPRATQPCMPKFMPNYPAKFCLFVSLMRTWLNGAV